MEGLNQE